MLGAISNTPHTRVIEYCLICVCNQVWNRGTKYTEVPQHALCKCRVHPKTEFLLWIQVWPKSMHPSVNPSFASRPTIFCVIPHGALPTGIMAYPFFSKLWSSRICRWTAAPVLFKLPLVKHLVRNIGSIPATSTQITQTLKKGDSDVGVVLDGIAGMFMRRDKLTEPAYINSRKGIVAIALKVGNVQIVPVYGFGHSGLWTPIQDPWGIMQAISNKINVSLVAFYGRWGWPLGPSRRKPVMMAFGDPIVFPPRTTEVKPTEEEVEKYHSMVVDGFMNVFEVHKSSFGWGSKRCKVI